MAAGAAVAALPYLTGLAGSAFANPGREGPAPGAGAQTAAASPAGSYGFAASLSSDVEPLVLIIKNDVVRGFKGHQEVRFQDQGLATDLKNALSRRFW